MNGGKKPMPVSFNISLNEMRCSLPIDENTIHMVTDVMNNRHQTNKPSFRSISLPSGPVKPARKTEICK